MKKKILCLLTILVMAVSLVNGLLVNAHNKVQLYTYTLFASSFDDGAISTTAENFCVNGNIGTNGTIATSSNLNVNGEKKEHANEKVPIILDQISDEFFSGEVNTYFDDYIFSEINVDVNIPIDDQGALCLDGNISLTSSIKALNDVILTGEIKSADDSVICSETGNITIDAKNVNLNGLIYAPYGTISIKAQNLNLNNVVIIANKILFDATNINVNNSNTMSKFVGEAMTTSNDLDINDDEEYIVLIDGEYNRNNNAIKIEWYTNIEGKYEIFESDNNEDYTSIAIVEDLMSYSYPISQILNTKYFKVRVTKDDKFAESMPLVVTRENNDYEIIPLEDNEISTNSETTTPYVMNAIGESGNVTINAESLQVLGNISSVNDINIKSNHIECLGHKTENDNGYTFDSISTLDKDLTYTDTNPQTINTDNCIINTECYYPEYTCYADLLSLSSKMVTNESINLNAEKIISEKNVEQLIESQNGSITLNCDYLDYTGLIYAPSGTITINASNITFSGIIIADEVSINGNIISLNENNDIFSYYNAIEQKYQKENDELINEYLNALEEMNNGTDNIEKKNNYEYLRAQLETRSLLLSDDEKVELFNTNFTDTTISRARSEFKPCNGIEKMYDVIRRSSSYPYNGRTYQFYSLTVTDKYKSSNPRFTRNYSPNLFLLGNCKNESSAKNILNKSFQTVFGKGLGTVLSSSGHKTSGTIVKTVIGKLSPFGTPSPHDLYTNSKNFFRLTDVSENTTMKYYWVKYKGIWEFAYSCDKTKWKYVFTFGKLNPKTRLYDYKNAACEFTNKGSFYKPYIAIRTIVDYKKNFGDKATTGNCDPYGYSMTTSYTIKNSDGKSLKTFKPLFIKSTIGLM